MIYVPVPEPTAVALLAAGGLGLLARLARRTRRGAARRSRLHVERLEPRLLLSSLHADDSDMVALASNLGRNGSYAAISRQGTAGDDKTSIVYDASSGRIEVDAAASVQLTSIQISSASGVFTGDPARNLGGPFDIDNNTTIFKATFGTSFGSLSFGDVAQPYLDELFVSNDLTVSGSILGGQRGLGLVDLIYVPPVLAPNGQKGDGQISIVYDSFTGRVELDVPAGVQLTSIAIESATGIFTPGPADSLQGPFDRLDPKILFKTTFGSSFASLSFGNVLAPGLDRQFLLDDLMVLGSRAGGGGLGKVDLAYQLQAPQISAIADQSTDEDVTLGPIAFSISDRDTPTNMLTVTATSSNQALIPDANIALAGTGTDRTITLTPVANQHGSANIALTVSDGSESTTESFLVTVRPVNDAPLLVERIGGLVVDINTPEVRIDLSTVFGDVDLGTTGDRLVFNARFIDNRELVAATITDSTLILTITANKIGSASIIVRATDTVGTPRLFAEETIRLDVMVINDAPAISVIPDQTVSEGTAIGPIPFTIGDEETAAGELTVTANSSDPTIIRSENIVLGGTGASRTIQITPVPNQAGGPVTITVTVSDGENTTTRAFHVTVVRGNTLPTISQIANHATQEDTPITDIDFTVGDRDTPPGSLRVTAVSSNQALIPNANLLVEGAGASRRITITPARDRSGGPVTITVSVSDGVLLTSTSFDVTVTAVNDQPTITDIANQSINEDTQTSVIPFRVSDVETAPAALRASATSDNQTLVPNSNIRLGGAGTDRTVIITPASNQSGRATVSVVVGDAEGGVVSDTLVVQVNPVNDAPVNSVPASLATDEDGPLELSAARGNAIAANDVDAAASAVEVMLSVDGGVISLASTNGLSAVSGNDTRLVTIRGPMSALNAALDGLVYRPSANFNGTVTLRMSTSDLGNTGAGGPMSDTDSIAISVRAVNDPPRFTSASTVNVPENSLPVITVVVTDPEGDTPAFRIAGGADGGAFTINSRSGALQFVSARDFESPQDIDRDNVYEVALQADDGHAGVATQELRVAVIDLPTVTIAEVSPNPRAGAVDQIQIRFRSPVTGFDVGDVTLTRATDTTVSVPTNSATLTTADNVTWTLGNLRALSANSGVYELSVTAISLVEQGDTVTWINGAGDSDQNNSFNQRDIILVLQGGKYLTGQPASWSQGDWNHDGLFNQFDIIAAQQTQPPHYLQGPFAADALFAQIGNSTVRLHQ